MCAEPGRETSTDLAERIRSILATRDLTLSRVSNNSAVLYGRSSPYFLPHNLYYDLRTATFTPSIYQIFALSRISGYRLRDWLRIFGFDLENIPRLQVLLPSNRTILLDSLLIDPNAWVPWFRDRAGNRLVPAVAPLTQLLEFSAPSRLGSVIERGSRGLLYVKIGCQDALAFPDVLPGSIVRVDPKVNTDLLPTTIGETSRRIFLVEHRSNLYCCRLRLVGDNRFVPISTHNPYAEIDLQPPPEVGIRGTADLEIRPLVNSERPELATGMTENWTAQPLVSGPKVSRLLRAARARMALSLREASVLSREIADVLGDRRYFISPSSLSDYEARDTLPRHLHKIFSVCVLYGLALSTLLDTAGFALEEAGRDSIPDRFMHNSLPAESHFGEGEPSEPCGAGFLAELLAQSKEIPFFLRRSLSSLSGLAVPSLQDFFWIGGERNVLHPFLTDGLLIIVNRRKKKPLYSVSKPPWQQSLYVIRKRDGTYLCACCGVENDTLVTHPYSEHFHRPERLRNRKDAEIVGQVVTIARKLS